MKNGHLTKKKKKKIINKIQMTQLFCHSNNSLVSCQLTIPTNQWSATNHLTFIYLTIYKHNIQITKCVNNELYFVNININYVNKRKCKYNYKCN